MNYNCKNIKLVPTQKKCDIKAVRYYRPVSDYNNIELLDNIEISLDIQESKKNKKDDKFLDYIIDIINHTIE